ncbi:ribosomal rna methyltransferase [Holotrichia oblita]|uniref:Ribosomal rna methyltransferase n=1 Tax=Holotrichia oblita TaxID=644536 RepID=A0ACB9SMG1_HOLOL|nr:ribosomal rna methyltransferase [Holotrichia oblita]
MKLFEEILQRLTKNQYKHFCTSSTFCKKLPSNLKGRSVSSQQWLTRQLNDPYVEKAKFMSYRRFSCRSAFKLIEIDDKYKILKPGYTVVDCGASPGSWTQVTVSRTTNLLNSPISNGCVIAIDKQYIHPIEGAIILNNSDFTKRETQIKVFNILDGSKVDVVLSDMAPNATGIKELDNTNMLNLCYSALEFAVQVSIINATFLVKLWYCNDFKTFEDNVKQFYNDVKIVKPKASRSHSAEVFILGRYFKGATNYR